jgi:hypothetical protein
MQTTTSYYPIGETTTSEDHVFLDDSDFESIAENLNITVQELLADEDLYSKEIQAYIDNYDEMMEQMAADRVIDYINLED